MGVTRRGFLSAGPAAAGIASLSSALETRAAGGPPRNVLLLMCDQHTRAALGAAGSRVAKTPNLDALARSGVLFNSAYCTDPVCIPSRASMLTGLYPHKLLPYNTWPYEKETAAHYFHRAGYMTGVIGKMHFLDGQTHGFDFKLDFNDWHQYLGPKTKLVAEEIYYPDSGCGLPQIPDLWKESGDPWLGTINRDDREGLAPVGRISALREEDHFESFVSRELIRFLKTFGRRHPFFLVGSLLKPHAPFMPAERFGNMFHPNDMQLPASWGKVNLPSAPKYVQESIKYW